MSTHAGKYYLVDSGYPNRPGFLAPYRATTYHIREFRHRQGGPTGKNKVFNYAHSSLRNVIERSFGILKNKWRILRGIPSFSERTQTAIIIACVALHNFVRASNLPDIDFDAYQQDDDSIAHDDGAPTEVEAPLSSPMDDGCMNHIRDLIADGLWAANH